MELEQIELNLNLGSADLGTLKAKSIQADLALGSLYADELQTGQLDATLALGSITVSGAKQASPYSANSKAANAVILDAALGDITLNFEE